MRAKLSATVLGVYVLLFLVVALVVAPRSVTPDDWLTIVLLLLTGYFLARYVSTSYTIDDRYLHAWRFLGGRRIPLEEVRKIEWASMRELAPTSGFLGLGAWGWRGRMFSPTLGPFDSIYTEPSRGLLVTAEPVPLYLSPRDREAFARELSRRVRSYTGALAVDVGAPVGGAADAR